MDNMDNKDEKKNQEAPAKTPESAPDLTTEQGVKISDNRNSLRAGTRGPTLLEDFILREKITHFDHERIPERVVHARGSAAHGYFQVYKSLANLTSAAFLQDPAVQTPVFVRFSTVAGSRGSADTARDVRGFAVKFYTSEGNFDLVGNNIPIFFIQDAIKFPDLVHAAKPEPNNEIPQASTAHDTFWDFISLTPESMHMIMWVMSDRAIPRSFRMMEGFGVHTFKLINAAGEVNFVKFHWKPVLGVHSLVWDEAQKLGGKDPDFHRRDLWEAILRGAYPEYELGIQVLPEADEFKFDFDILDATKIWPEDLIPVQRVGKMTLNRNPDNFFAETEQAAFHAGNVVPGIDVTNDPLLQGRLFSYVDTQLIRLGGPNFAELPINRPKSPVANNQRDGYMRYTINKGRVSYEPASLDGGTPEPVPVERGGFASHRERLEGEKVRVRSESFSDHYGQARLFWNSMSAVEQQHIIQALQFELGKVETRAVRQRMLGHLLKINSVLASHVAFALGEVELEDTTGGKPAARNEKPEQAKPELSPTASGGLQRTSGLSQEESPKDSVKSRKVALLVADGFDANQLTAIQTALKTAGAVPEIVAEHLGFVSSSTGQEVPVDKTLATTDSIMYDGVFVVGGKKSVEALGQQAEPLHFLAEAYKHFKTIGLAAEAADLLTASPIVNTGSATKPNFSAENGVIIGQNGAATTATAEQFIDALKKHRHWNRPHQPKVPA